MVPSLQNDEDEVNDLSGLYPWVDAGSKTSVLTLGPCSCGGIHSPQMKTQSIESHTSPMLGLRVNERTSGNFPWRDTSGPDYLLIYCLFTLETVPYPHPKE